MRLRTHIFFLALASVANADTEDDPKPRVVDPSVLSGPFVLYSDRPAPTNDRRACSVRVPVCVHGKTSRGILDALGAFEQAWQTMTGALGMPAPDVDPTTLAYDVFLSDIEGESTVLEARDIRSRVDRGRGFTLLDRRLHAGCKLDATAATALARASLLRVAPATEAGSARAQARYLAELAFPCAVALDVDAIGDFQAHAEDAIVDGNVGALVFWNRIDWAYGRQPGGIALAAWALHPTMTPVGARRWNNEPDTFDVLRLTFKNALSTGSTVHDLWLDFGIARAFVGSADDGAHIPELRTAGDAGKVPLAWDIPWPTTPRRLAQRTPVAPTGASYLVVHRAGAKPSARLRVEIEWEEHALFRWAFVKLDANGRELGRIAIPTKERATEAQMTLVDLENVDRVMLVGVNVGDPAYAFDPDDEVFEPHGWLVTVAEE